MNITPESIDAAMVAAQTPQPAHNLTASRWKSCDRQMWFTLRNASPVGKHSGKLLRTFTFGHALEPFIIDWLRDTGAKVSHQQARLLNKWGRTLGLIDGVIHEDGEVYLLEIKTANSKAWKAWAKDGAPDYYKAQVQLYMHHSAQLSAKGTQLVRCLFAVLNKDTSEMLIDVVDYDPTYAQVQTERVYNVVESESLPTPTEDYKCSFCDHAKVCNGEEMAEMNCRTCANVSVVDGDFVCEFGDDLCPQYVMHPQLIELMGYQMTGVNHENRAILFDQFAIAPSGVKITGTATFTSDQFKVAHKAGLSNDPQIIQIMRDHEATLLDVKPADTGEDLF